jgi:hypothetical protein
MRDMMSFPEKREIPRCAASMQPPRNHTEMVPMHPDDFEAHLAWIMAKRFHELVLKETFPEKSVYYRIVG